MKAGDEDTSAHELVLIRRRAGSEDAPHHGGVWKIAYADFMTAMMAFFLVMWLINSTDQRVLTQVANYFNPMRLTDSTPQTRGLNTIESGEQGKQGKQSSVGDPKDKHHANTSPVDTKADGKSSPKSEGDDATGQPQAPRYSEQALFSDPFGVLARIAAQAPKEIATPSNESSAAAGESFRDPFDASAAQKDLKSPPKSQVVRDKQAKSADPSVDTKTEPGLGEAPAADHQANAAGDAAARAHRPEPGSAPAVEDKAQADARKIVQDITSIAAQMKGAAPNINVTIADDGVLISLTDDYDFGMFAIASAEPRPALVAIMEKIAKIVKQYQHAVTVRGHTDSRPYRTGNNDNWRLSTARAQMAYYMLVRGGVDEKRFDRIEGYADRSLRIANDPEAAQNRRIEILLRRPVP